MSSESLPRKYILETLVPATVTPCSVRKNESADFFLTVLIIVSLCGRVGVPWYSLRGCQDSLPYEFCLLSLVSFLGSSLEQPSVCHCIS